MHGILLYYHIWLYKYIQNHHGDAILACIQAYSRSLQLVNVMGILASHFNRKLYMYSLVAYTPTFNTLFTT